MKFLILFFVLVTSVQPLQAGFCDMDKENSQEMAHHMDMPDADSHDCCDPGDQGQPEGCDSSMDCGFCFVSAFVIPGFPKVGPVLEALYTRDFSSAIVLPSHSSPPFRPPIS